jgi:hypothetical protein
MRANLSVWSSVRLLICGLASLGLGACAGSNEGSSGAPISGGSTGAAASSGSTTGVDTTGVGGIGGSDGPGTAGVTGTGGSTGAAGSTGETGTGTQPQAGLLTAGTWDDNLNFDFYQHYLTKMDGQQLPGRPLIARADRLEIRVTGADGAGVGGANVTVSGASGPLLEAPTRSDGRLFFFPGVAGAQSGDALQITATLAGATATSTATVGDGGVTVALDGVAGTTPTALDLVLVIDTTGSMGDEIQYLKAEVSDIAARIASGFPNVSQRWALILYRDQGDEYVVRSFDFTGTLATFQTELAAQSAGGGGDYPESPEQALAKLTTLSFGQGSNVARMAFWIADAPHHVGQEGVMVADILKAQKLGIHLYPIAASGADELVEYTMRTAAEVTGGRYLFLTDDSGIGGSHEEPTIPCYFVTTLSHAMSRMAAMELTGTNVDVASADVIRTSGNPTAGHCTLADGQLVTVL